MLGRRVWSERDVQRLTKEFVCVADEVWNLVNRDIPAAQFFKRYGENCPAEIWNRGATTKQGLYLMSPDADHLGAHFARHNKADTVKVLREALANWKRLCREKDYENEDVPERTRTWDENGVSPRAGGDYGADAALILKVYARDLPGRHQNNDGTMRGAFNQHWVDFNADQANGFLPQGNARSGEVTDEAFRRLAKKALFDNVRGQTEEWRDEQITTATMTTEVESVKRGKATVILRGDFAAGDDGHGITLKLYGEAIYDTAAKKFVRFELVATGTRRGGTRFNFRGNDEAETPIGFALVIEGQDEKPDGRDRDRRRRGWIRPR